MRHEHVTGHPEPTTADKIHFWLGGSLHSTFYAWAQERIRSRWFPLWRTVPLVLTALTCSAIALVGGRSLAYVLLAAAFAISIGLAASFLFRDRLRSRALRRYPRREAD